jgi:hypothetical protein
MNFAQSIISQEYARAVGTLCQAVLPLEQPLANDRLCTCVIRVLLPLLLAESLQIILVQRDDIPAAAFAAPGAVPSFDNRQWFDWQSQRIATSQDDRGENKESKVIVLILHSSHEPDLCAVLKE